MPKYIIKVWETKEEREQGISNIIESGLSNIGETIKKAKKIMDSQNYVSLEVQDSKEKRTLYFATQDEETEFSDLVQEEQLKEKVNKYGKLVVDDVLKDNGEDVFGLVRKVIEHLEDIKKYFKENKANISKEEREDIVNETEDLIEEIKENYDDEDYISLYTYSMSDFYEIDENYKDILETLLDYYELKLEEMEYGKANIKDVVDFYFDYYGIQNLMDYGEDRDAENMPTISSMYERILDCLKIKYDSISTKEVRGGKYVTVIDFTKDYSIEIDTKSKDDTDIIYHNIKSIDESYKELLKNEKVKKIEKIKSIDIKGIIENYYTFNQLEDMENPDRHKTVNKKELFANMYKDILEQVGIDVAFVTIDELSKNRYKTTIVFPNEQSDYYYSKDLCSKETAIKNIENMKEFYIKSLEEVAEKEQDMELE